MLDGEELKRLYKNAKTQEAFRELRSSPLTPYQGSAQDRPIFLTVIGPSSFCSLLHPWLSSSDRTFSIILRCMVMDANALHVKKGGGKRNLIIKEDLICCMGYVDLYQFISTTVYILTSNLHINTLNHVYINLFGLWCRSPKVFINNIHVHVHLHFAYRTVLVLDIFAMTFGSLSIWRDLCIPSSWRKVRL